MPSRTLVICCDGMWNKPEARTNIWRTFDFLRDYCGEPYGVPDFESRSITFASALEIELSDGSHADVPIFAFYGESDGDERGGRSLGVSLGKSVLNAYAFVARHWRPGARIFIFGFSRGAHTARSLAGMLNAVGIVDADDQTAVGIAWEHYRRPPCKRTGEQKSTLDALQKPGAARGTTVRFLGVWETVGLLGVPVPLRLAIGPGGDYYRFHDTDLDANVLNACQALAIHERRSNLKPVLWTQRHDRVRDEEGNETRQRVLQVWFIGGHGDVGGAYHGDHRVADISLTWMLRRALECGHPLVETAWVDRCEPNPFATRSSGSSALDRFLGARISEMSAKHARKISSLADLFIDLIYLIGRTEPRQLGGEFFTQDGRIAIANNQMIHCSVIERYASGNLPTYIKNAIDTGIKVFYER